MIYYWIYFINYNLCVLMWNYFFEYALYISVIIANFKNYWYMCVCNVFMCVFSALFSYTFWWESVCDVVVRRSCDWIQSMTSLRRHTCVVHSQSSVLWQVSCGKSVLIYHSASEVCRSLVRYAVSYIDRD